MPNQLPLLFSIKSNLVEFLSDIPFVISIYAEVCLSLWHNRHRLAANIWFSQQQKHFRSTISRKKIEMEIAKRRAFVAATKSVARFHRLTPASSSSSNDKIM